MDEYLAIYPQWTQYTPKFSWTEPVDNKNLVDGLNAKGLELSVADRAAAAGCPMAAYL